MMILTSVFYFAVALGVLIAIHEAGHFAAARMCGVYVERFALGFGPRLCSFRDRRGTEYALCAFPLGGYVKMYGENPADEAEAARLAALPRCRDGSFAGKKVWQRFLIVFAGPFCNILLAWGLYSAAFVAGVDDFKPAAELTDATGAAARAGFADGDLIVSVGGVAVADWEEAMYELVGHTGESAVSVAVRGGLGAGPERNLSLDLSGWNIDPRETDILGQLGIEPLRYRIGDVVSFVAGGSAAEKAGLRKGDRILGFGGGPWTAWKEFAAAIRASPGRGIALRVERDGAELGLTLTPAEKRNPDTGEITGFAGISPEGSVVEEVFFTRTYPFGEALLRGAGKTVRMSAVTLQIIGKFCTGDISVKNVSGPIGIAKGAGITASLGFVYFLGFLALISVNLGILNLMPVPFLDGGHLFFYAVEAIRGRPLSEAVIGRLTYAGMFLLLGLMVLAVFNDLYYGLRP